MTNKKVTEEDIARAIAADNYRNRGLSDIAVFIKERYKESDVIQVFIFYSPKGNSFHAYLFYRYDAQISDFKESGLSDEIRADILEELERVGRGKKEELVLHTTFDSDENVKENYGGDYFDRLR